MKQSIQTLKGIHSNKTVAVLGGGPSLPGDLKRLPDDCITIGVNYHWQQLTIVRYCVFMDKPKTVFAKKGYQDIDPLITSKISQNQQFSDYLLDVDYWDGGFSSTLATWLACFVSSGDVLLCGMDCYQTEPYFHDIGRELTHRVYSSPLKGHLKAWNNAFDNVQQPERIKAVSGPLISLFGQYE